MEEGKIYLVEITPEAENYFLQVTDYLYTTHTPTQAAIKSDELLEMAMSLSRLPRRGSKEERLAFLDKEYRYLVYRVTSRRTIKILYVIEDEVGKVYVTDFFGTEMADEQIASRNQ